MKYLLLFLLCGAQTVLSCEKTDISVDILRSFDEISKIKQCEVVLTLAEEGKSALEKECERVLRNKRIAKNLNLSE
jgi:hypothetical protein